MLHHKEFKHVLQSSMKTVTHQGQAKVQHKKMKGKFSSTYIKENVTYKEYVSGFEFEFTPGI